MHRVDDPAMFARHELLRVDPACWPDALAGQPRLEPLTVLRDWVERGWPVIARRRLLSDDPAMIPVAVALPPDERTCRIALTIPAASIVERRGATRLSAAMTTAPFEWQQTIAALVAAGNEFGSAPAVFGSLLWQHETALRYLTASSDLDVVWPIARDTNLPMLLHRIGGLAASAPMPIDGELVFPGGAAVQWREFASGAEDLLVKTAVGTFDCKRALLLASLDENRDADARP